MSQRATPILQAFILFLVGSVFVWFYTHGRINAYLTKAGSFQIQALLAGVVLCIIAVFLAITAGQKGGCGHDHDHDHDHDHGHSHDDPGLGTIMLTAAVVLVPLLSAAIFTPDAYSMNWVEKNLSVKGVVGPAPEAFKLGKKSGEDSAREGNSGEAGTTAGQSKDDGVADAAGWGPYTIEDLKQQVDRNEKGEFMMDVISLFYTGGDEEIQNVVKGLPIETMGQVMPEKMRNPENKRVRVFRLMMNCCIADARPVSIPVQFDESIPRYKEMGWYKIRGTMAYEKWDEFTIPVLHAKVMEITEEPPQAAFGQRQ